MQQANIPKKRIEWIDILRCLGMWFVVIGHMTTESTPDSLRFFIYSFHMPLFFMISGASYYLQTKSREYSFKETLASKSRALLWPYLTLNIIAMFIWVLNFKILSHNDATLLEKIMGIIYSNEIIVKGPTNATWFIPTLFLTTVAFYLVKRWSKGDDRFLILMILALGALGYGASMRPKKFHTPWHFEVVPMALVMFLLGYLCLKHLDAITAFLGGGLRQIAVFVICFAAAYFCAKYNVKISMASNSYGSFWLFMGSSVGFSLDLMLISMWIEKFLTRCMPRFRLLQFIGKNTLVYLAFHAPMLSFMKVYSAATKTYAAEHPFILGNIIFVVLIPITYAFDRWLPFLLGRRPKKSRPEKLV